MFICAILVMKAARKKKDKEGNLRYMHTHSYMKNNDPYEYISIFFHQQNV